MQDVNKNIIISINRKAYHDYDILKKTEAGIELKGTEVRSLRDNKCSLTDTFVLIKNYQAWLYNMHISPFKYGNISNVNSDRRRRLLLHKNEIRNLYQAVSEKGLSIIPLKIYFKNNVYVKIEIALSKGRKLYDKRHVLAKKTQLREAQEYLKQRNR